MYRIHLSAEQQEELRCLVRQTGLAPSTRERLEMVRLSDAGWSIPRIARYLGQHEQTVRAWIKAFLAGGFAALENKPRGRQAVGAHAGPAGGAAHGDRPGAAHVDGGPGGRLAGGALRGAPERGSGAHPPQAGTAHLSADQPQSAAQARPRAGGSEHSRVGGAAKKGAAGLLDLCHLDEAGFGMTLPPSYSWFPRGARLRVPYEAAQGRRVNAIGAYFTHGPRAGRLEYQTWAALPKSRAKTRRTSPRTAPPLMACRWTTWDRSMPSASWTSSGRWPSVLRALQRTGAGSALW